MNEKDTKELLEKSIIETSNGFTDKLMQRIEVKERVEKTIVWRFKPIFSILIIAMLAISFTFYKYLESSAGLFDSGIEIGRTPIFLIGTILLFLTLNYILRLNEVYNVFKFKA